MSFSACQWTPLRIFVFSSLMVLCFLGLFFTYNLDIKLPSFGIMEKVSQPCPTVQCPVVGQSQETNPNCSTERHDEPHPSDTKMTQAAAVDTEPDTIVLIWMWPFGNKQDPDCRPFNINGCLVTDDRTFYHKAHGVFFHHRDINGELAGFPQEPRPWFQKWVWMNMESPANSAPHSKINHLMNLTCSFRLDSSIPVPYGYLVPRTPEDESFKLPAKDKLVCWIVSRWSQGLKRVQYFKELKKHITVHGYGDAFNHHLNDDEYKKIVPSCKFYLSFENSVYKDYMTEKLFVPMRLGSVPVVLGTSRQNYEDHIPADSFIHVDDFSSAKELADRLNYLDQNDSEYMAYLSWTSKFKVKTTWFGTEHACRTCSYLQKHKEYQAFHDLNKWYWG